MKVLENLFERHFNTPAETVRPLSTNLGGSPRKLYRLERGDQKAVGVLYDVREENVAFLEFSRHFRRHGLPVPEIYSQDLDNGAYLEEDLGDTTLFEFASHHRREEHVPSEVLEVYRKAVEILPRFQIEAGRDLNYTVCYPRASFDRQSIAWDLNYFKYYFLRLAGIPFNEQALEDDFNLLTDLLLTADRSYFLYRDFQSRNVMVRNCDLYFLDYQGGRKGALQYDIASLLFDSKADLPPPVREHLLLHYLSSLERHVPVDRNEFMRLYYPYVYVRMMQALGAYGFRGFYERKPVFLQSVPFALKNIRWLLHNAELPIAIPALHEAFTRMLASERLSLVASSHENLIVRVFSFSFHQSSPQDPSGNGGGFVFDARSLPNPGREDRFKALTGKDQPVIELLDHQPGVQSFIEHVFSLIDSSIEVYKKRSFKNLMISFGCTGGQHRSVYLAERLAKHLRETVKVDVELRHIELEKQGR